MVISCEEIIFYFSNYFLQRIILERYSGWLFPVSLQVMLAGNLIGIGRNKMITKIGEFRWLNHHNIPLILTGNSYSVPRLPRRKEKELSLLEINHFLWGYIGIHKTGNSDFLLSISCWQSWFKNATLKVRDFSNEFPVSLLRFPAHIVCACAGIKEPW